jgi:hypothetical protein
MAAGYVLLGSGRGVTMRTFTAIREFGPYANRADACGGYFVVDEWEFHWFEDAAVGGVRPSWMKTRDEAMRAAVAASRAVHAGALPC